MLELKHIMKTFNTGTVNEKKALNDLSLTLNDGDFVTVIGGNGAGKSTMLNMIAGVYPVDSGSVIWSQVASDVVSRFFSLFLLFSRSFSVINGFSGSPQAMPREHHLLVRENPETP